MLDTDMSSYCVDLSRHCLDMQNIWACLDTCRHFQDNSLHCLDALMITLGNGLERKKIIYICLERYVSVCSENIYFYQNGVIQMQTVL